MKSITQIFAITLTSLIVLPLTIHANTYKAAEYIESKNFQKARSEYLKSASVGSAMAFYQLGTMTFQGIGTKKDLTEAIVWFSLAAELEYKDSRNVATTLIQLLPNQDIDKLESLMIQYENVYGQTNVSNNYFPQINHASLTNKITFDGKTSLDEFIETTEHDLDMAVDVGLDSITDSASGESFDSGESDDITSLLAFVKPAHLLVADFDIAPDGTMRNAVSVQSLGYTRQTLEELKSKTLPIPQYLDQPVYFNHRIRTGIATFDRFDMSEKSEYLYAKILREARELKKTSSLDDKYEYAVLLLTYPWLPQKEGEALTVLLDTAKAGHPGAQFEYGLKQYREQTDVESAIKWLYAAAQFGVARAQYQLGNILQYSPWVNKDETKAMRWYQFAAQQDHSVAALKIAELKLSADDKNLHNFKEAVNILAQIEEQHKSNPEYYYLYAISRTKGEHRDIKVAFSYLSKAIRLAESYNWNVSDWHDLMARWTTGNVQITSESY
ncbi:tetratricopeptide repeat protein [Catenovulum adriaticum]|uniref:TPR repeat protein n=1 Tax=Catenovulum adriaticum TaxID=2984846 RepID=A0ABY7ATR0_9ALTE|nr:hypothetical protein [Catenovulum sp. TS8]WAJ71905.1 hypothetical protein OLW01_14345 [Catenovulum sp. TS8]